MPQLKMALIAVIALSGATLGSASAMPVSNLAAAAQESSDIQNVRVVCGPFRCWWQPNYYWGPRYHWWYRRWWWHRRW
jgi:hypothetical protein